MKEAFGKPGLPPNWSSASKQGIGTACNDKSKVWFTIANGIITEVFYPTIDTANIKDLQFLVTDGKGFFHEERKDTVSRIEYIDKKALAYKVINTAKNGSYRIIKRIVTDPESPSIIINVGFEAIKGRKGDYHLYLLFAPHIKNRGYGNSGRASSVNGKDLLITWRDGITSVVTADIPFDKMSFGYSGHSDGWQDLQGNLSMDWEFENAENGNIAGMAGLKMPWWRGGCNIVLSFGENEDEAVNAALNTLKRGYKKIEKEYISDWNEYLSGAEDLSKESSDGGRLYWISAMVLKAHIDKSHNGGVIASLSIPWGEARGDADAGGYHLVWPRDIIKAGLGFMAMGNMETPIRILKFMARTQKPDGSWHQNMWLDGRAYWSGIQLDEVAFPIILAWRLKKMGALNEDVYPMIKKAASFLVREGPITEQERWEENSGFSPSTLAVEIAALICAAHWAKEKGEDREAKYLFDIADYWQTKLEDWTFTDCGCLLPNHPGHYQRIAVISPEAQDIKGMECQLFIPIKNMPAGTVNHHSQCAVVDGGFLELVRYGIRPPDDIHVLETIPVIDSLLKTETPYGPGWHRYNNDGYGETEDGAPFTGSGIGRLWPILTGERGMYEFLAGKDISPYIEAMEGFANDGGMIPEQVWDREDIPENGLFKGRGTGSATPLVWAHAEYVKLLRSKRDCRGCDIIPELYDRYVKQKIVSPISAWKKNKPIKRVKASDTLRVVTHEPAILHWSKDGWRALNDDRLMSSGLGTFYIDITGIESGWNIVFTFYYPERDMWEGMDYEISVL